MVSGQTKSDIDAGLYQKATIGDFVWNDSNANGIQDTGEAGIAGVTVQLKNATGTTVLQTATTDANGHYSFSADPGAYSVAVTTPANNVLSAATQGTDTTKDSDFASNGSTAAFTVVSGQTKSDIDAGLYQKAEIGDRVWDDANKNGIQDTGETGVAGVKVSLLNASGVAVGSPLTTDANGNYLFTNLTPGTYSIQFDKTTLPTGYVFTTQNAAGSTVANDSNANTSTGKTTTTVLTSGQSDKSWDAGIFNNVTKATIGDFVWDDTNGNGIQDAGEKGISGVSVKLLDSTGKVSQTATTDCNGKYSFSVDPGSYKVQVITPSSYYITKANQGTNDAVDSDIDTTGTTSSITVTSGQQNITVDAGFYKLAHVGDRVWEDWNHNWLQDTGEVVYDDRNNNGVKDAGEGSGGIPGITVNLLDSSGKVLQTTKTDATGTYGFDVAPGTYSLQFDKTNVVFLKSHWDTNLSDASGYNMSTWKWAPKDTGTNDAIDSDVAGDGIKTTDVSNTDKFTLTSGQIDLTRDAGITPIVIDLNGDGIQTVSRSDSAGTFDLLGNGQAINSGWLSSNDGFLVVDNNNNGKIDDISELFGGLSKGDGFAKLASYDSNHDGVVNASDVDFAKLQIWQDLNGDHKTENGELFSLADKGISSLTVNYTEMPLLDAQGNLHLERSNALLVNGNSVDMTDVYFNVSSSDVAMANVEVPTMAALISAAEINSDLFWIG